MRYMGWAVLLSLGCALTVQADSGSAKAAREDIKSSFGFVPRFLDSMPDSALPGAWAEMKGLQMNPNTALPGKIKELIGLAVAAQVPCAYCVYAHTEFAELFGASKDEVGEAVVMASLTRHWSTVVQGQQTDLGKFKAEIAKLVERMKASAAHPARAEAPAAVMDAEAAREQIQRMFGAVPGFLQRFPDAALPGAWTEMRDVEMSPTTALSGKHKSLIGLAVASQIPCRFCLAADTEFARLEGATEAEIQEAIAMAAITRHWSTYLNGTQQDLPQFRREIDRLIAGAKKQMAADSKGKPVAQAGHPAPAAKAMPGATLAANTAPQR